jgi:peptide/nickel transport system substrate-binding protein
MFKKLVPILLVFVFVLTACGGGPAATEAPAAEQPQAPAATEAPKPTEAPPAASKTVTFIWTQEFDTLNYIYSNMWFSSITLQLWSCSAWDFDENNKPQLVLAKEMPSGENGGISADGKVITIKLREDAVWSDGTPLTADDFVFTYKMTVDPANTVASQHPYDKMVSVEAPDKYTVVTTFAEPFAPWQTSIWKSILPAHVLQPVYDKDGNINSADWNRNPTVGCGPFVLDKWESGSFARFIVNEKYWLGRPKLDEIFIRFVPDDASQIAALKTGEGDLGTFISWSDVPDLEAAGIAILQANSGYNEGFYFNLGEKGHVGLKDVKVRQAIAYGIDRESIVKDLLLGGTPVTSTDWEKTVYADPTIVPYPYDPEKAKSLLDEAGWKDSNGDGTRDKDGVELKLTYGTTTREIRKDTQAVVQQQLGDIGIGIELQNFDSDTFFSGYADNGPAATGALDIFEYSTVVGGFPDPDTSEWLCDQIPTSEAPDGSNWQAVCDPELDALLKLQISQVDPAARIETFHKISRTIFDKVYWLGLWYDPDLWAIGGKITGAKISGVTPFFNIMEWDLK